MPILVHSSDGTTIYKALKDTTRVAGALMHVVCTQG